MTKSTASQSCFMKVKHILSARHLGRGQAFVNSPETSLYLILMKRSCAQTAKLRTSSKTLGVPQQKALSDSSLSNIFRPLPGRHWGGEGGCWIR